MAAWVSTRTDAWRLSPTTRVTTSLLYSRLHQRGAPHRIRRQEQSTTPLRHRLRCETLHRPQVRRQGFSATRRWSISRSSTTPAQSLGMSVSLCVPLRPCSLSICSRHSAMLSVCLSVCSIVRLLSVCLSACLSGLFVCLLSLCPPDLSVCFSLCMAVGLSVSLSVPFSICLPVSLCVCPSYAVPLRLLLVPLRLLVPPELPCSYHLSYL